MTSARGVNALDVVVTLLPHRREMLPKSACAGRVIGKRRSERGTTMRRWLIMFGTALASIGLQAVQAQVTIDITEITCNQFLGSQITDPRTLGIWLNGYANGARGKTLIDPLSVTENNLIDYCVSHNNMLVLDAARNVVGADK
jgi:acid stress chaperone HdeB